MVFFSYYTHKLRRHRLLSNIHKVNICAWKKNKKNKAENTRAKSLFPYLYVYIDQIYFIQKKTESFIYMYINITVSTYNNNGTQYTITHPINQYQIAYKGYWHIFMYYMYMLHPLLNSSFFFTSLYNILTVQLLVQYPSSL